MELDSANGFSELLRRHVGPCRRRGATRQNRTRVANARVRSQQLLRN
jgi:hypothetical protein